MRQLTGGSNTRKPAQVKNPPTQRTNRTAQVLYDILPPFVKRDLSFSSVPVLSYVDYALLHCVGLPCRVFLFSPGGSGRLPRAAIKYKGGNYSYGKKKNMYKQLSILRR